MYQLRCRTEFDFGSTFGSIARTVERLKALGVEAAGIVDPGTWGHVQWDYQLRKAGIRPLFGVATAVVPSLDSEDRPRMWFLAASDTGLRELYRWRSLAEKQAARGSPRLTYEDVRGMSDEITKFAGQVLDPALLKAVRAVIDIDGMAASVTRRKALIARDLKLPYVLVSDNAYPAPGDRQCYEMVASSSVRAGAAQHLLSREEMNALLPEGLSLARAQERMRRIGELDVKLPYAPLIKVEGDLEALCRAGIRRRGLQWKKMKGYEERLQYELRLIREKDYESYFLVVADMVAFAKQRMLVGPSRGSAAGSLVCYLTAITEIDPIPCGLIFERFIDVTRKDLPDIDLDFVDTKREEVIQYLQRKYGADNVAHIGTVSTYQPKSALVAVAKRLGIPPWETNAVKDSIFARSSGDSRANFALLDTLEQTEPGQQLLKKHPAMRLAAELEAHASHCGVHAGGILVCNDAIHNYCTITAASVAQIDKKDAEALNLLKIDVLGLRTLGVLEDSGVEVDWYGMKFDDHKVYALINARRYAGVFQFEGQALQEVAGQMVTATLDDIGHITALARPGPLSSGGTASYLMRRMGKEKFHVPHALLEPYVKHTYGVVIYQEQVLQICRELGRMSWEDVTLLRKAMSKSLGKEYFDQFRDKFVEGARANKIDRASATEIWEMVNTMGSWAFNLAHSYSYAVVSYWTAWLKANHLLQFAAATLRSAKDDESAVKLLRELVREGVHYTPFDPARSAVSWSVQGDELLGGFTGLKGIGESKARALITKREANGGVLPPSEMEKIEGVEFVFADVFPTESRFGEYYKAPEKFNLRPDTKVSRIEEIAGEAEYVYIGRMRRKDLRDHNEVVRIRRRNGKRYSGQTLFLDLDIEDDTGRILTRIERQMFESVGRPIWENAKEGSWWLVRGERKLWGRPDGGFKMIYVSKIKQLA